MFVKLFSQILDSSIADNRKLRHFFTDFLLCADMQGFVMMTESAISRRIGASLEEVEWGISELVKPDPRSKTPDAEGARIERLEGQGYGWRIINYEAYRALKSADDMRAKTLARVRKHREKKSCNAPVTPCNASNTMQREKQKAEGEAEKEEIPPNPQGGTLPDGWKKLTKTEQGRKKVNHNTPLMIRLGKFFGQKETTLWTVAEYLALQDVNPTEEEIELIEDHFSLQIEKNGYRHTALITLLNNWPAARNRADTYFQEFPDHRNA